MQSNHIPNYHRVSLCSCAAPTLTSRLILIAAHPNFGVVSSVFTSKAPKSTSISTSITTHPSTLHSSRPASIIYNDPSATLVAENRGSSSKISRVLVSSLSTRIITSSHLSSTSDGDSALNLTPRPSPSPVSGVSANVSSTASVSGAAILATTLSATDGSHHTTGRLRPHPYKRFNNH